MEKIVKDTGLEAETAHKALAIMLSLVKSQGDQGAVEELFARLPGAAELAAEHGGDGARGGGLMAMLGGGAMGGPLAAVAKLQAAGLTMEQIKQLGRTVLEFARDKAGDDVVRKVAGSIPGLGGYL